MEFDNKGVKGDNLGQDNVCEGRGWNGRGVFQVKKKKELTKTRGGQRNHGKTVWPEEAEAN